MNLQVTATVATDAYNVPSIKAYIHSFVITGLAVLAGFLVQAATDTSVHPMATSSIPMLWDYAQTHWIGYAITQVVAPGIRALTAPKNSPNS